jgi:homoserine kinase type II
MGLFTPLPLSEARRLGAEFGLDVAAVESLSAGSVNSNYRLTDASGTRYFARAYEEQGQKGAEAELRLLIELSSVGVPVPVPRARAEGGHVGELAGKPFAVYPWVDGEVVCQARVTEAHMDAIGTALGRIHAATPRVTPLSGGRFRPEDLRGRLARIRAESPSHAADADLIESRLDVYVPKRDRGLPAGVIHGDLFRDNTLFVRGTTRIASLVDFESASQGCFAFDMMVTLLAWCYGDAFREDLVNAFLSAYSAVRPVTAQERDALPIEGAIACLRFATTRITDFAMRTPPGQTPGRDYRRFLGRLAAIEAGALSAAFGALVRNP